MMFKNDGSLRELHVCVHLCLFYRKTRISESFQLCFVWKNNCVSGYDWGPILPSPNIVRQLDLVVSPPKGVEVVWHTTETSSVYRDTARFQDWEKSHLSNNNNTNLYHWVSPAATASRLKNVYEMASFSWPMLRYSVATTKRLSTSSFCTWDSK